MRDQINFARGIPAEAAFPRQELADCVAKLAEKADFATFQYGPASGPIRLREWLAEHHGVGVDNVMVGDGSVTLFDLLCRTWTIKGQTVLVEEPCYDRVLHLLRYYGANVVSLDLEDDGPSLEALEKAVSSRPKFFYTVPDFQNPSGLVWSTDKRQHLVKLARERNFLIVEDSPYRLLRYKGAHRPSFLEIGPDVTVQLNSFSKIISPGLRAAYLIGSADTLTSTAKMAEGTYVTPGNFALSVAAEWLHRGHLPAQLEALKRLYGPRAESMYASLREFMPRHRFKEPEGGFFIGVTLADVIQSQDLRAKAKFAGVDLSAGEGFFVRSQPTPFLRLPFGSMDEDTARRGIEILARVIDECRAGTAGKQT